MQNHLINIIKEIRESNNIHIPSNKTENSYALPIDKYNFIEKVLHSKYKTVADTELKQINKDYYDLIDKQKLLDKTERYNPRNPHFTLKGHKENFETKLTIRHICPTKSNISKISKSIIDKIILKIKTSENLPLWIYTRDIVK